MIRRTRVRLQSEAQARCHFSGAAHQDLPAQCDVSHRFYNPSLVILGGGVAAAGDMYLATIRQSVYGRSLPLATRELRIVRSSNLDTIGLLGAAFVVLDELFSRRRIGNWINEGSPAGKPGLTAP